MLVHDCEFSSKDTTIVHVASKRLGTLIIPQNLGGTRRGHGRQQETVAHAMLGNLLLQSRPIPSVAGRDIPHVELEHPLGGWRSLVCFVGTLFLGEFHGGLAGSKVECFENILVELTSSLPLKRQLHHLKCIRQPLHTNSNRTMSHIARLRLLHRIKVTINHPIQILGNHLGNVLELVQIKTALSSKVIGWSDEFGQTDGGKVAYRNLIRSRVLDNFGTEVGALDGTQILLIGLGVAVILVQHVWRPRLHLRIQNGKPKLLRLDSFATPTLLLVLFI
mmetsp:Transcript_2607/g.5609  ORF Transcript_2607/g.5609 Transcript_2607/m.5609 type:complete len:277 (+) Transcript_2607:658-1488(+)